MNSEELNELLEIPMETRMDAEKILFVLEQKPDGFITTTWQIASSVFGERYCVDESRLFALDTALELLCENHGLLLDRHHHDYMPEGLPFNLDFFVWHKKNALDNGKFDDLASPAKRNYQNENDELVAQAIGKILQKALPACAIPTTLRFHCRDLPALDAEILSVSTDFYISNLWFDLGFSLYTGRGSLRMVDEPYPDPEIDNVEFTCEGDGADGNCFEASWNPETGKWSNPLPLR